MAARFIRNPEVVTGLPPLCAMGRDPAAPNAELREQMSKLMAQGPIDLGGIMFTKAWIQGDDFAAGVGAARCAEKPCVPFDADFKREFLGL